MAKRRRVRMDRFNKQVAEHVIGPDSLVELEIGDNEFVTIKLPVMLDEGDDFVQKLESAQQNSGTEVAKLLFSFDPDRSADEQYDQWIAAGLTERDLAVAFAAETAGAHERMGKFRFNA